MIGVGPDPIETAILCFPQLAATYAGNGWLSEFFISKDVGQNKPCKV